MEDAVQFTANILEEIKSLKNVNTIIFDAERALNMKKINLVEQYQTLLSNIDKDTKNHTVCAFIGIDKFLTDNAEIAGSFSKFMKQLEEKENYSIMIVENANKIKTYEFEDWYKNYITKENGIWIGNGIDNQYLITINSSRKELFNNCGRSFGYIIKDGISTFVKLLEMKEDEDNE